MAGIVLHQSLVGHRRYLHENHLLSLLESHLFSRLESHLFPHLVNLGVQALLRQHDLIANLLLRPHLFPWGKHLPPHPHLHQEEVNLLHPHPWESEPLLPLPWEEGDPPHHP